ncbi:MAG: hypothetical protein V3R31_01750, partial [Candidatus Humimicrobiaceae bacterium]
MKKIIIQVVVSIVVIIFVFTAGLWAGFSFNSIKKYLLSSSSISSNTQSTQEERPGLIEGITETIRN